MNLRLAKEIVIIGVGNTLMRDEGVGVRVIERLRTRQKLPANVEVLDCGMTGIAVVHAIAGRRQAIFVDCAQMGNEPGTIKRFTPAEVASVKYMPGLSQHEGDLIQVITLSENLGEAPEDIIIYGIEPGSIEPGESLTALLQKQLPNYCELVEAEVKN